MQQIYEEPATADINQTSICIKSLQDLFDFYENVELEMDESENQIYLDYFEELRDRVQDCDQLLGEADICLESLGKLTSEYEFVANKTSSLHSASERLLQEQHKLNELADEIKKRLNYFTRVENIHQRLQNPTFSVAGDTFVEILNKIDESLEFIRQNVSVCRVI